MKWLVLANKTKKWPILHQIEVLAPKNILFGVIIVQIHFTLHIEVLANPPLTTFPITWTREMVHQASSPGSIELKWSNLVHSLQKVAFLDSFLDPKLTF